MNTAIISLIGVIITGVVTIVCTILTNMTTREKVMAELKTQNAVQNERLDNLKEAVDKHNNFASKIPVIEQQISDIERRLKELERK